MLSWTWLWLQEKGFVVFMIATSLLVFSIFFLGMSTVTTLLGLLLPAYWSLQMLTSPLDSASATAMPLYWLLFTGAKRHNPLASVMCKMSAGRLLTPRWRVFDSAAAPGEHGRGGRPGLFAVLLGDQAVAAGLPVGL